MLPVLEEIYAKKKAGDIVGLSGAHAHLAHLITRTPLYADETVEELIKKDIHCNREAGCDMSGGSLGHAVGTGLGYALADRSRDVYIVITDGSLQEGSEWEALALKKRLKVDSLKIYANFNGFTAVQEIDRDELSARLRAFCPDAEIRYTDNGIKELQGLNGHYDKL